MDRCHNDRSINVKSQSLESGVFTKLNIRKAGVEAGNEGGADAKYWGMRSSVLSILSSYTLYLSVIINYRVGILFI
jgi:hypothetical protein